MTSDAPPSTRVVLVTGLSGAGKASVLRALEDLGYEAIDNPPMEMIEAMVARETGAARPEPVGGRRIAVGVDARTRGFDASGVLETLARLRRNPTLLPELLFAWADEVVLQRRYTETRRRHPLSPHGTVAEGIAAEEALTAGLREAADLVIDTSELPLPALRRLIDERFGVAASGGRDGLSVAIISFAFPAGLPREADMVFDVRFLRNPHYVQALRPKTGLDAEVGAYVEADPDFHPFFNRLVDLLASLLPRFVQEGKKYVTIAIGCTGGRHRSVFTAEKLAGCLAQSDWRLSVNHRELVREIGKAQENLAPVALPSVQAQEA